MTEAIKKNGVKFGVILGVVAVLFSATIYAVDVTMLTNWALGLGIMAVYLIIGIVGVISAKKAMGGYISFKEAFTTFFIIAALGMAISVIFNMILLNIIDPAAKELITEKMIETTLGWVKNSGMKAEDIKKMVEDMRAADSYGYVGQVKSYFWILLFYILIGLIVAAATKKNKPFEFPTEKDVDNIGNE